MRYASASKETDAEKKGWEFIFLGANIDAIDVAGRFGVAANRAVRYENDADGAELNYGVMSKMVSLARASKSAAAMSQAFEEDESLDEIRGDYEEYVQFSQIDTTAPDYKKVDLAEIEAALPEMSERLRNMTKMLYGLDGESRHTYEEVARAFRTTDGRVRQNESRAKRIAKKVAKGEPVKKLNGIL